MHMMTCQFLVLGQNTRGVTPWKDEGDANIMQEKMATCVQKIALEVLGVTKESGCDSKDTWWWNEDV